MTRPIDWSDIDRLAVVGIAKNSGKTTTLNFVLEGIVGAGRRPGLVSMGIDGESVDALVGVDKPSIWLPAGSLLATADRALDASGARFEYLDILGFETPLGEACIVRVIEAGTVVLGGMRHREDVAAAVDRLEATGAEAVLVDGAYDRMAAADGTVGKQVVLSTGAVVGADVDTIVERTAPWIERLRLPCVEDTPHRRLLERAIDGGEVRVMGADRQSVGSGQSALMGLQPALEAVQGPVEAVAVPGLISDGVVESLADLTGPDEGTPTLLARDPTVFRVESAEIWQRLCSRWKVRILDSTRLLGVSVNPTGVQGHRVDGRELMDAFERRWPDLTVFDPRE